MDNGQTNRNLLRSAMRLVDEYRTKKMCLGTTSPYHSTRTLDLPRTGETATPTETTSFRCLITVGRRRIEWIGGLIRWWSWTLTTWSITFVNWWIFLIRMTFAHNLDRWTWPCFFSSLGQDSVLTRRQNNGWRGSTTLFFSQSNWRLNGSDRFSFFFLFGLLNEFASTKREQ